MKLVKTHKSFLSWLPPVLWMALIFWLSSFPKLQVSEGIEDFILRKLAHMTEYAILLILIYRSLISTSKLPKTKALLSSFLLTFLYAVSDEYHQTLVPGRAGRALDVAIDSSGALLGVLFVGKIIYLLPKKFQQVILCQKEKKL